MSRATHIAIGCFIGVLTVLAIAVALLLSYDWNHAKPWITTQVSDVTGRTFAVNGDLSLTWQATQGDSGWRAWIPWPRLTADDVTLGNADWAKEPWMAHADKVTLSISPLGLLRHHVIVPVLALHNIDVLLERGREPEQNNWTFTPRKRSGWKFNLQRVSFNKGSVRFVDAVRHTDMKAEVDTLGSRSNEGYLLGWRMVGRFRGEEASGDGRSGSVLSFKSQDLHYPLELNLRLGQTRIDAKGTLTGPMKTREVDLLLKISGISMAHLYPLFDMVLPETRPFSTEGRLRGSPGVPGGGWSYEDFKGKVGISDMAGSLRFSPGDPRPRLEGTLTSGVLNVSDLSPLVGADSKASKRERGVRVIQPENRMLPVEPFKTERWNSIDTDVQFTVGKIVRKNELPIDNVVTRIRLEGGVLSLAPVRFGLAGGTMVANLRLDARAKPVKGELKMTARHLKLQDLFRVPDTQASTGEINGDVILHGSGNSIAGLFASSNGEVRLVASEGTVSKLVLDQIGLNVGDIVVSRLFGDEQVKLHCAVADLSIEKGMMRPKAFVVDTETANIYVSGSIDLAKEQLALTLQPESKGLRLISLGAPLYVTGSLIKPKVEADKGVLALRAGSALALGVLAPVAAALIPLIHVGPGENSGCNALMAKASERPDAKAMKTTKTAKRRMPETSGR